MLLMVRTEPPIPLDDEPHLESLQVFRRPRDTRETGQQVRLFDEAQPLVERLKVEGRSQPDA